MQYIFKIRFNTEHAKNPGLCWRVMINEVEHIVADVNITVPVKTTSHMLPSGEKKWSIFCESDNYRIDENKIMDIY